MWKKPRVPGERRWRTEEQSRALRKLQFILVQLCHHGIRGRGVHLGQRQGGWRAGCGAFLSCCCCGYTSCMVKGKSWAGSHICRALWDSRWWCRRLSAEAELDRNWTFHLAAGCSCSVSGMAAEKIQRIKKNPFYCYKINYLFFLFFFYMSLLKKFRKQLPAHTQCTFDQKKNFHEVICVIR